MPSRRSASATPGSHRTSTSCSRSRPYGDPVSAPMPGWQASSVTPGRQAPDDLHQRRRGDRLGDRAAMLVMAVQVPAVGDAAEVVAQGNTELRGQALEDLGHGLPVVNVLVGVQMGGLATGQRAKAGKLARAPPPRRPAGRRRSARPRTRPSRRRPAAPTRPGRRAARPRASAWPGRRPRPAPPPGWRTIRLALVRMPSSCVRATPAFTPALRPKSSALTIRARSVIGRAA